MLDQARELADELADSPWANWQPVGALLWEEGEPLYRLVRSDPPRIRDFWSQNEKGRPPVGNPSRTPYVLHVGISMFASTTGARQRADPPTFIAEVAPLEGHRITVAKTLGRGHFTVWAEPEILLARARVIEEVTA